MNKNLTSELSWVRDNAEMHQKFGVHEAVAKLSKEHKNVLLKFRLDFILEELKESYKAAGYVLPVEVKDIQQVKNFEELSVEDAEEVVDGLVDVSVVAIGTLDILQVDADKAWSDVHRANMSKVVGVKESRPNPLNLPDLIKLPGWQAPSHAGNHGMLTEMFGK